MQLASLRRPQSSSYMRSVCADIGSGLFSHNFENNQSILMVYI